MDEERKIFEWFCERHDQIVREAKENGTWINRGFDGNQHLFKPLTDELEEKLKKLKGK